MKICRIELTSRDYPPDYFDVCTLNQVLEHVPDPSALLREINRVLKKNGSLLVGVPNFVCFDSKLYKENWAQLDTPRHLYQFDFTTLRKLLELSGFKIEEFRAKGFYLLGLKNLSL